MTDDEFWLKSDDVAEFLDYKRPRNANVDNVLKEWQKTWTDLKGYMPKRTPAVPVDDTTSDDVIPSNWLPYTVFISESVLYALVTRSKEPEAVKFAK